MTLDRDVRFSRLQLRVTRQALRDEVRKHSASIKRAEAARSAGRTIQQNVLDSHYAEREAAQQVLANLNAAEAQLDRRAAWMASHA